MWVSRGFFWLSYAVMQGVIERFHLGVHLGFHLGFNLLFHLRFHVGFREVQGFFGVSFRVSFRFHVGFLIAISQHNF